MAEALARTAEPGPWSLAALAEEPAFDQLLGSVSGAIADRFALKVHQNIVSRRMAYIAWIDGLLAAPGDEINYRTFVDACANLIGSLARYRIVSYSAMIRDPGDRMIDIVLKYPNEVTALMAGAALYTLRVSDLTGAPAGEALAPLIVENAAAMLARRPESAARFRELLRLSTPWT